MAITGAIIAGVGLATSVVGAHKQNTQAEKIAGQQQIARGEQKAANAAQAAQERRNQIREERVRRAKILQASENTGVSGSSGETGAIGGMSTALSSNIGANLGSIQRANTLSDVSQNIANFEGAFRQAQQQQQMGNQLFSMGTSIFGAAGGFGANTPSAGASTSTFTSGFGTSGIGTK